MNDLSITWAAFFLNKYLYIIYLLQLGGLALEREVRALTGYLNSTTSMTIRERLARLGQIAKLLNMEKASEIADMWARFTWRLAPGEVRKVLKLR